MITNYLSSEVAFALSQTLIHSVWQMLLIGLILFFSLKFISHDNAEKRYQFSLAALVSIFVISVYTFLYFLRPDEINQVVLEGSWIDISQYLNESNLSESNSWKSLFYYNEYISNIWSIGFVLLVIRLVFGIVNLQFISQSSTLSESSYLDAIKNKLVDKMGIDRKIEIYESNRIQSPVTFGFVKSLILLPIGIVNQLTESELETIIAHELSHIARYDFIINIFQSIIETLFYYHPVMWWISNKIKTERELCCDKVAIKFCNGETHYAQILIKLQEINLNPNPKLAMQFSSNQNIFSNRIKRILKMKNKNLNLKDKLVAVLLVSSVLVFFSFRNFENRDHLNISPIESLTSLIDDAKYNRFEKLPVMEMDTTPRIEKSLDYNVKIQNDEEDVELNFDENGLVKLKIDGKEIPPSEYDEYQEYINEYHVDIDNNGSHFQLKFDDNFPGNLGVFDADFEAKILELVEGQTGNLDSLTESITILSDPDFAHEIWKNIPQISSRHMFDSKINKEELKKILKQQNKNMNKQMKDAHIYLDFAREPLNHFKNEFHLFEHNGKTQWKKGLPLARPNTFSNDKPYNQLEREFNKDGLLEIGKYNRVELTLKHLKINGDKQPKNIHRKYMSIFVNQTGFPMTKKTKLEFQLMGRQSFFSKAI